MQTEKKEEKTSQAAVQPAETGTDADVSEWEKHILGYTPEDGTGQNMAQGPQQKGESMEKQEQQNLSETAAAVNQPGTSETAAAAKQPETSEEAAGAKQPGTSEAAAAPKQPEQEAESVPEARKEPPFLSVFGAGAIVSLVLLFVLSAWYSLLKYNFRAGLLGGEYVGLKNYQYLLNSPMFLPAIRNSLVLKITEMLAGLVVALPVLAWVRLGKKPGRILTKACLCLVPMCFPYIVSGWLAIQFLPHDMLATANGYPFIFMAATALQTGGFIAFCGGFFSYLHKRGIGNGLQQGILTAVLVLSLSLLTPTDEAGKVLSNALNRAMSNTIDQLSYSTGLQMANFSVGFAADALKAALQLLLAIVPALLLKKLAVRDESRTALADVRSAGLVIGAAEFIWLAVILGAAAIMFGVQKITADPQAAAQAIAAASSDQMILSGLVYSLITAGIGGLFAGLVSCGFISLNKNRGKRFGLLSAIFALGFTFTIARYLIVSQAHLVNTVVPVILRGAFEPRLISLSIVMCVALRMAPERRHRGLFAGMSLLGAAFMWGNFVSSLLYIAKAEGRTLANVTYMVLMRGAQAAAEPVDEAALMAQLAMRPVLLVLTALPAVLLGFLGAFYIIRAFRKAE